MVNISVDPNSVKEKYNGWVVINKPKGVSSNLVVQKVKKLLGKSSKVGHAGTLDPLADGVLPVALGEATKTTQYMMDAEKEYEFSIYWGEERSTYDAEGEVTAKGGFVPELEKIEKILPDFIGIIKQMPPIYSALKVNGVAAYKLARAGEDVNLKEREITIKKLEVIEHNPLAKTTSFKVLCGKGTYVRSLAVDIARKLRTLGYVCALKRTKVGKFLIKDAIMLANLDNIVHNIEPITFALGDILAIEVSEMQAKRLKNGVPIFLESYANFSHSVVQILFDKVLQATACVNNGTCTPLRVFNI